MEAGPYWTLLCSPLRAAHVVIELVDSGGRPTYYCPAHLLGSALSKRKWLSLASSFPSDKLRHCKSLLGPRSNHLLKDTRKVPLSSRGLECYCYRTCWQIYAERHWYPTNCIPQWWIHFIFSPSASARSEMRAGNQGVDVAVVNIFTESTKETETSISDTIRKATNSASSNFSGYDRKY